MAESHSKGEQRYRPLAVADGDGRSPMARTSGGLPFKPYVWRGSDPEPPEAAAARQRHRRVGARIEAYHAEVMPEDADPVPPWEWYREMRDD